MRQPRSTVEDRQPPGAHDAFAADDAFVADDDAADAGAASTCSQRTLDSKPRLVVAGTRSLPPPRGASFAAAAGRPFEEGARTPNASDGAAVRAVPFRRRLRRPWDDDIQQQQRRPPDSRTGSFEGA